MRLALASRSLFSALAGLALLVVSRGHAHAQVAPQEGVEQPTAAAPAPDAQCQYVENAVGVVDRTPGFRDARFSGPTWEAFQLRDHHAIEPEVFFRIAGRDDLVRRERRRAAAKKWSWVGGVALVVGGSVAMIGAETLNNLSYTETSGRRSYSPVPGLVAAGVGLASLVVSAAIREESIDAPEAMAVGEAYDRALRDRLKLAAASDGPALRASR